MFFCEIRTNMITQLVVVVFRPDINAANICPCVIPPSAGLNKYMNIQKAGQIS